MTTTSSAPPSSANSDASASDNGLRRWMTRLQSVYVLPTARTLYLLGAVGALITLVGAVAVVAYFHAKSSGTAVDEPLPPPYTGASADVDVQIVAKRLSPPTQIRFVAETRVIVGPVQEKRVLGHFDATSLNSLAAFPRDFAMIGGKDAELFERVRHPRNGRTALALRAELAREINTAMSADSGGSSPVTRTFEVKIVAYDQYGNRSEPADLRFTLTFGMPATGAPQSVIKPVPTPGEGPASKPLTELEQIARDISQLVDPDGTPKQFDAYKRALRVPSDCRASGDQRFTANYRNAFSAMRPRLSGDNVEAFYVGLCEAWDAAMQVERSAASRADAARAEAVARNVERRARVELENAKAMAARAVAMTVVGGALGVFLVVAFFLALLAIEGHSLAIRRAMDQLASSIGERDDAAVPRGDVA